MGETRVDLLRLLEDLRDAYPGQVEETIITEIVSNSLDSGAREIAIWTDPAAGTFAVVDDGKGMGRPALGRYHDLAVTSKRRGRSIGFAGVGIKLGLLVSDDVVTETRTARARNPLATSWRLASRTRAPWRWIEPFGVLEGTGTATRLYLTSALSLLLDPGFIEGTLVRSFEPLLDPLFAEILEAQYPAGVRFRINDRPLPKAAPSPGRALLRVRVGRQRKPSGAGYLVRDPDLADDERGIAVSTLGKVIKRGWDWLGMLPARPADVGGLVEVPALAEALTLNKADFVRSGARGAAFLAYRKAVQEAVSMQLEEWGQGPERSAPPRKTRSLERDLQSVLADLSKEYPLLVTLVERRPGGQRRLALGGEPSPHGLAPGSAVDVGPVPPPADVEPGTPGEGAQAGAGPPEDEGHESEASDGPARGRPADAPLDAAIPGRRGKKTPTRLGLRIRFESRPDDASLGRLVESTVWVNGAHPAYRRAVASRSEGYHMALTVAMSLAALAVEPDDAQDFVADFLARWGKAGKDGRGGNR